jgi:hypothetical protein
MTRSISLGGTIGFTINKLDDNLKDLLSELTLFKSPFPVFLLLIQRNNYR